MANQYKNKIVYNGNTLIDLTSDTITAADLASGKTAHDKSGAIITGTNTYDSDTSDDTAEAAEILLGREVLTTVLMFHLCLWITLSMARGQAV